MKGVLSIQRINLNPYSVIIFGTETVVCLVCCKKLNTIMTTFIIEAKTMNADQTAPFKKRLGYCYCHVWSVFLFVC